MYYVRSKGDTEGTRAAILKLSPTNRIRSMAEYVTLMSSSNLPQLKPFVRSMVGLGIVISFLVILLNMHTMVMERTREVGILKALGFSRFDVVKMLLGETMVLTLLGAGFGIFITFLTAAILQEVNPGLTILITRAVGCGGDSCWPSSVRRSGVAYPALRAASYDPVVALAYE